MNPLRVSRARVIRALDRYNPSNFDIWAARRARIGVFSLLIDGRKKGLCEGGGVLFSKSSTVGGRLYRIILVNCVKRSRMNIFFSFLNDKCHTSLSLNFIHSRLSYVKRIYIFFFCWQRCCCCCCWLESSINCGGDVPDHQNFPRRNLLF